MTSGLRPTRKQLLETNAIQAEKIKELEKEIKQLLNTIDIFKDAARINAQDVLNDIQKLMGENNNV